MSYQRKYCNQCSTKTLGKLEFHEQVKQGEQEDLLEVQDNRKVLIIHTGGTIGSFKNEIGKFQPQKNRFKKFLETYPYFKDHQQTYFLGKDGFTITPESIFKRKIWYKFKELDHLFDSSNLNLECLNMILATIEENYDDYDAFVLLHGTDTMSFTASALSFMIQNLKKTIVITGAQIPIGETRNDSTNNLMCSLTIAGHYHIPEVILVFDDTIMRGNRTTKISSSSISSFSSPNDYPIGKLGLKIQIKWEAIRPCRNDKPTTFIKLTEEIGHLKLIPFGFSVIPKTKYLVIESFGVGNIPTFGKINQFFVENSKKPKEQRITILNISQVSQSVILNIYATGHEAQKLGLIPGSDMTCQAAVAKLTYLASKGYDADKIKEEAMKNLRGELTEEQDRIKLKKDSFVMSCNVMLQKNFTNESSQNKNLLLYGVYPTLVSQRSTKPALTRIFEQRDEAKFNINYIFPSGESLLHKQCKKKINQQHQDGIYFSYLIEQGIDLNLVDKAGNSAFFYCIENERFQEAEIIAKKQGKLIVSANRIFQAIRNNQITLLYEMERFGDEFLYKNIENRNCLTYSIIIKNRQAFDFFKNNTELSQQEFLNELDIYGKDSYFYLKTSGWSLQKQGEGLFEQVQSRK